MKKRFFKPSTLLSISGLLIVFLFFGLTTALSADECKNRGVLDVRYCDEDGDLVADPPKDPSKYIDPPVLVFSYTPVEDPSVYVNVFTEFLDYLSEKTGKKVKWYGAESYAAQVEAMRSGRLHIAGISTGPTCFGVNLAGYVPFSIMGTADGPGGYYLHVITHKDSDIKSLQDLKGRKIAHVTPSSNSGNQAPRALFKAEGVIPDKDYKVIYSGKHDNSIMGVANKDYDAAPIANIVLERMAAKGVVNKDDLRVIWKSPLFPTTSYGYINNLDPALAKKIVDAFLTFDWKGTGMEEEFGKQWDRFVPITYKEHWAAIRAIQKENGVVYSDESLKGLKVKKKKKKKK